MVYFDMQQNTEPIYAPSSDGWNGFSPNSALLLTAREQPFLLTQAHLKNMSQQDFCLLWKVCSMTIVHVGTVCHAIVGFRVHVCGAGCRAKHCLYKLKHHASAYVSPPAP